MIVNCTNISNLVSLKRFASLHGHGELMYRVSVQAAYLYNDLFVFAANTIPGTSSAAPNFIIISNISRIARGTDELLSNTSTIRGYVRDILVDDSLLFVLGLEDCKNKIVMYNISDPTTPYRVDEISIGSYYQHGSSIMSVATKMAYVDGYIYAFDSSGKFSVISITDSSLMNVKSLNVLGVVYDITVSADKKYMFLSAGAAGVLVYNISNKEDPTFITQYNSTVHCAMSLQLVNDSILLVADNLYGLHALNISDLASITEIDSAPCRDRLTDILVDGDIIFGADMRFGVSVYRLKNGTHIEKVSQSFIGPEFSDAYPSIDMRFGLETCEWGWEDGGDWGGGEPSIFSITSRTVTSLDNKTAFLIEGNYHTILSPLIVYEDTNGDGKLTYYYETYPNSPYTLNKLKFVDRIFFAGYFGNVTYHDMHEDLIIETEGPFNTTWCGRDAQLVTIRCKNMLLVKALSFGHHALMHESEFIGNFAYANVTFNFYIIPFENITEGSMFDYDNITVKVCININLYNVDWNGNPPENYSIALGFCTRVLDDLMGYPINSLYTGKGNLIKAGDVSGMFIFMDNFSAFDGTKEYTGKTSTTTMFLWEDGFPALEYASHHVILLNFPNIPANALNISYDPEYVFFPTGINTTLEALQLPPIVPSEAPSEELSPFFGIPHSILPLVIGSLVVIVIAIVVVFIKRKRR
ncbi:MAG: hypothetical protein ABGF52_10990 [Candidatus Asgardarchaeum sp.]